MFLRPQLIFSPPWLVASPQILGSLQEVFRSPAAMIRGNLNKGDSVPRGSTDNLVCAFAVISEKILVALDGDMKGIAKAHGASNSIYSKLNLVKLSCTPPEAAARLKVAMSLIEHEWHVNAGSEGRRLYVEVLTTVIRTMR